MDTSKEYIEMCRKAPEIQELWKPEVGDIAKMWLYRTKFIGCVINIHSGFVDLEQGYGNQTKKELIWLPRQDQLQDIIGIGEHADEITKCRCLDCVILDFYKFWRDRDPINDGTALLTSMEQLWLAFVMHEKYRKKWDGEEWIFDINKFLT